MGPDLVQRNKERVSAALYALLLGNSQQGFENMSTGEKATDSRGEKSG